ncbi:MAG: M28 family peptidase [Planctomycetota bacterium]
MGRSIRLRNFLPLFIALLPVSYSCSCGTSSAGIAQGPEQFDQARAWSLLERIVAVGPRPSGTPKIEKLIDLMEAELKSYGLAPIRETFEDKTPIGPLTFTNLYVDLEGETADGSPAPMVVICTHFDTKRMSFPFVGANDGGSGTAVLLELARILAERKAPVTYRLLFLDGEESILPDWRDPDNRYGSRYHVAQLRATGLVHRVKACVLIDLVGDKELRFMTELNSDRRLLAMFFDAAKGAGLGRHVNGRRQEIKDDHLSFMAADIPSIDLIDLDYGPGNRFWHTPDDTLENCSAASLGATGKIVLLGLPAVEEWVGGR